MNQLREVISSLQSKIEKLVHLQKKYEEENIQLLFENNQHLNKIELQTIRIKELEQNNNELKNAASLSAASSPKNEDSKNKINELVKEIDECIALLTK
jgi:cysteinyl-tRNA synthetase